MNENMVRAYRMLRREGMPSAVAYHLASTARKAERIFLDFQDDPFTVEHNGRPWQVKFEVDFDADRSYLEDVPEDEWPESFYGLTVTDLATGEWDSLWSIEYDGRTPSKRMSGRAYLFTVFEDLTAEIMSRVSARTSHG